MMNFLNLVYDPSEYNKLQSETIFKDENHHIQIVRTNIFGKALILNKEHQSSESDEHIYHECLVHPALLLNKEAKNILVIGVGPGAPLREILKHKNVESIDAIDINKYAVEIYQKHLPEWSLGSFSNNKVNLHIQDAFQFLSESKKKYDLIYFDLFEYGPTRPVAYMYEKKVFELISERLTDQGLFVIQAGVLSEENKNNHIFLRNRIASVFQALLYGVYIPSFFDYYGFIIAHKQNLLKNIEVIDKIQTELSTEHAKGYRFLDKETIAHIFYLPSYLREIK